MNNTEKIQSIILSLNSNECKFLEFKDKPELSRTYTVSTFTGKDRDNLKKELLKLLID